MIVGGEQSSIDTVFNIKRIFTIIFCFELLKLKFSSLLHFKKHFFVLPKYILLIYNMNRTAVCTGSLRGRSQRTSSIEGEGVLKK